MSNTEQSLIFGIPFLHYKTKNWKKYRRYLQESFYGDKYTDFWDDKTEVLPDYCDKIVEVLTPSLQKFADVTNPYPVMITEMWYEKSQKGDQHALHNHGGQGYSAVLYLKYNPEVHKPTLFYSQFHDTMKGDIVTWEPPDVEEGDLIIFPSVLAHEARPNESDEERIVVSFNIASFQQLRAYNLGISETEKRLGQAQAQIKTKGAGRGGFD
tara:strand:+ start:811 stop:1443 length:633 start_codon:yes stop_codon:yes gene_type:complete